MLQLQINENKTRMKFTRSKELAKLVIFYGKKQTNKNCEMKIPAKCIGNIKEYEMQ